MYGLTIWQKNNSQEAILHLRYLRPAPDTAIRLDRFPNWRPDGLLDPFVPDDSPIRPMTNCLEVACNLHAMTVSDFRQLYTTKSTPTFLMTPNDLGSLISGPRSAWLCGVSIPTWVEAQIRNSC